MTDPQLFLKYNYPETKDLCLHFLTLITAVLVFSLNFAERVFDFQNAAKKKRFIVIFGWCLFLLSIMFCGIGLTVNSIAGGDAVYQQRNYQSLAQTSYEFIILSGISFVIVLVLTMISAITSRQSNIRIDARK